MKGKMRKILTTAMVALLTISMSLPAFAATKEDTKKRIEQLESEKSALQSKLSELKEKKTSTEEYIEQLDAQLNDISADISDINTSIEDISTEIDETEKNLEAAKEKEAEQYEVLKLRIKHMYEQGQTSYLDILFNTSDIETMLNSSEYISQISDFDEQLLKSFIETCEEIDAYEKELEEKKSEMEEKKVELEGKQAEVNEITEAKKEELESTKDSIDVTESDISDVQEDLNNEAEVLAALEAAEAEAQRQYEAMKKAEEEKRRQEEEAKKEQEQQEQQQPDNGTSEEGGSSDNGSTGGGQAQNEEKPSGGSGSSSGGSGLTTGTGSMTWPLPGYTTISSPFGYRNCPFHGPENHDGVDIPAPGGTGIHAADSGVVVVAQYHYSLGNYIIINHGNGIQTYYLHTSAMYVSVGDTVNKGDVIAAVGTTGSSTGNHLDFRVNVNGSYVNPVNYAKPY